MLQVKLGMLEVGMCNIEKYYSFKLSPNLSGSKTYALEPIMKFGNNKILNAIFENRNSIKFKEIGPIPEMSDYYGFKFSIIIDGLDCSGIFETCFFMYPHGILRIQNQSETIFFRMSNQLGFEAFVFKNMEPNAPHYFQLLIDGYLNDKIEKIKRRIESLNSNHA
jgi:hypothetical protein